MTHVHYSSLASRDLYELVEYIARDKPEAAYHWLARAEATCQLLADNPELGEKRVIRSGECRSFSFGNYVIFYRAVTGGVEIIRIVQGRRDIENL